MDKEKFYGLDELRGYAAVIVLLMHSSDLLEMKWLFPSGYLAVDLFFLMSGFVVAHSYEAIIPQIGIMAFVKRRAIRFYPLLALGIAISLIGVAGLYLTHHDIVGAFIALPANLLFIPSPPTNFSAGDVAPLDGPQWSLILEVWINLSYAMFLPWLRARTLVGVIVIAVVALGLGAWEANSISGGPHLNDLWIGAARICVTFPIGVLLYRNRVLLPRLSVPSWVLGAAIAAALMIPGSAVHDLAFVLLVCPLVVAMAAGSQNENVASRYGASSSYCVYIIHFPILVLLSGLSNRLSFSATVPTILAMAALLAVSPLLDRYYDRPIRRWLTRRISAPQPATA